MAMIGLKMQNRIIQLQHSLSSAIVFFCHSLSDHRLAGGQIEDYLNVTLSLANIGSASQVLVRTRSLV